MPPIALQVRNEGETLNLGEIEGVDDLARSWRVVTKDSIKNGSRLENLSWRLWHKQQTDRLDFKKLPVLPSISSLAPRHRNKKKNTEFQKKEELETIAASFSYPEIMKQVKNVVIPTEPVIKLPPQEPAISIEPDLCLSDIFSEFCNDTPLNEFEPVKQLAPKEHLIPKAFSTDKPFGLDAAWYDNILAPFASPAMLGYDQPPNQDFPTQYYVPPSPTSLQILNNSFARSTSEIKQKREKTECISNVL